MSFVSVCIVCIFVVITITLFKQFNPTYAVMLSVVATAVLLIACLIFIKPIIDDLSEKLSSSGDFTQFFSSIIKCVGIFYLSDFTVKLCEENANKTLTIVVELLGKGSLIFICLPYIEDTLNLIERLLEL